MALFLEENAQSVVQGPERALKAIGRQIESLQTSQSGLRNLLDRRQARWIDADLQRRVAGRMPSLLSLDTPWFWLSGLLAVGTLGGIVLHARRHSLRRRLDRRIRRRFVLGSVLVVALLGALLGVARWEWGEGRGLREEGPGVRDQASGVRSQDSRVTPSPRHPVIPHPSSLIPHPSSLGPDSRLAAQCREFRRRAIEVVRELILLGRLAQASEADLAALDKVNRQIAAQEEAIAKYLRVRHGLRAGLGAGLLGLVGFGGWRLRRVVRRRHQAVANTCPLCLGPIRAGSESTNGRPPPEIIRCRNLVSREPRVECNYAFRAAYRRMSKLSFPTLGVPKAGKTHWLAMLHWQLTRGLYPRSLCFEKLKRLQAESGEDYDRVIEQVLYSRLGTAATQRDRIPYPVVFQFRDRDRWGRSSVLVNVFDYSGEVTTAMGGDDYRRRRALRADGFFFFLDPTFPSEPQAKALAEFHEDLALVRGIPGGRDLGVPVAVCVSKIDLLPARPFAMPQGGDVLEQFYQRLKQIDPSGESLAEDVLRARSELVVRLRDAIWPGWEVERSMADLFAGRWLFFPLTPVGLDGRGEADLNLRTIAPFGLLEPLAWLLEKNGYPVLD